MPINIRYSRPVPAALGAFALSFTSAAARAESVDLDWLAIAYVWAAEIGVDSQDASVAVDFSDVIDKLEMGFQGHMETQADTVGGFVDVSIMDVGDNSSRELVELNSDLDMTAMDLALVWSPGPERMTGFEVFGGLRYIDMDFELVVDPIPPSPPESRTSLESTRVSRTSWSAPGTLHRSPSSGVLPSPATCPAVTRKAHGASAHSPVTGPARTTSSRATGTSIWSSRAAAETGS